MKHEARLDGGVFPRIPRGARENRASWELEAWQAIMRPGYWQQIHGMGNSNLSTQQPSAAQPGSSTSTFRARYLPAQQAATALADPGVLAVFGFGTGNAAHSAPHWLQVPLTAHGEARIEVWQGDHATERGVDGAVRWSRNAALLFSSVEVAEVDGDIEAATATAYAALSAFQAQSAHPYLLRTWNYLDAITEGDGDNERYRRFCLGRVKGLQVVDDAAMPAATCIGGFDGRRRVQVYCLSAAQPGAPLENPRQVSAYAYPRQYGPQSPSFARAMLPPLMTGLPLLQSGTAAIVGHLSQHHGSVAMQLDETLTNLQSLIDQARQHRPSLAAQLGEQSLLKVYVRNPEDAAQVSAQLLLRGLDAANFIVLHSEVCRAELLVEIEGMHG